MPSNARKRRKDNVDDEPDGSDHRKKRTRTRTPISREPSDFEVKTRNLLASMSCLATKHNPPATAPTFDNTKPLIYQRQNLPPITSPRLPGRLSLGHSQVDDCLKSGHEPPAWLLQIVVKDIDSTLASILSPSFMTIWSNQAGVSPLVVRHFFKSRMYRKSTRRFPGGGGGGV